MFRYARSSAASPRVKVTAVILSILIGLAVTLTAPLLSRAQDNFVLLYSDNFDDGQAQDWDLEPGWAVDIGNLNGSGHHFATYTRGNWGKQPFTLKFTLNQLSGGLHVNIFARGHDNGLDRYAIGLRKIDNSTLYAYLFKQIVNPSGGNAVEGTFSVDFNRTYTVEISSDNGTIQVYVYKTQVGSGSALLPLLSYTDNSPLEPGTISFETLDDSSYARLDDVEVWGVQPPPTTFTFTGEVFSGEMYDASQPLSGVVVEAYGSNNPYPNTGQWLTQTTTDQNGQYSLDVPAGYEFYFIHAETPSGYEPVGADSINGSVRDPAWIEFRGPLDNQALSRNRFWHRIPAPRGPDLSVRRIDYPHYNERGYVLMSIVVENGGNEEAPASQLVVADHNQRLPAIRATVLRLRPGAVAPVEVQVPITDRDRDRTYEFDVTLDPDNRIGELDEANNWASTTVFVPPPNVPPPPPRTGPDLSVRRIDDWHIEGDHLILRVVFANDGNAEAPLSEAALSDQDNRLSGARSTVPALRPNETVALDVGVSLAGAPRNRSYVLDIMIDPDNRIAELSESNNRRSTSGIFISPLPAQPAEPPASAPPPIPPAGPPYVPYDVLLVIAAIILVLWGLNRLLRRRRSGRAPAAPIAPPIRLIKLWITEGDSGKGRLWKDNKPLQVGASYSLHVQVQPRGKQAAPKRGAGEQATTSLDVVFFSAENDFTLGRKVAAIDLPGSGSSTTTYCAMTPREPGLHRVRVCVYYRNTLLQSAMLDAQVVKRRGRLARGLKPIERGIDYVTSATLTDLDRLPHPALNIVTNQTNCHTHWIGVFSTKADSEVLRTGDLRTFETTKLTALARKAREQLLAIENDQGQYRFRAPLPLNGERLAQMEQTLIAMAVNGWKLYHELFIAGAGRQTNERLKAFKDALASPSLISVARCRDDSTTVPWAALYSQYLDTNEAGGIKLCEEFKAQLAANQWSVDQATLSKKHDLLDSPQVCRGRPQCPLKQEQADRVVCPFGFWGMLHEIEQPLDQVTPTPDDQIPPEIIEKPLVGEIKRDIWLIHRRSDRVHIAMAVYPDMAGVAEHRVDLEKLYSGTQLSIDYFDDRKRVLQSLKHGSEHVYYFFCHGEIAHDEFRLKLGPSGHPGYISANNLNPPEDGWHDAVHPLIVLNGCETMAVTPELLHGFMGTLRHMGAAGIVGSEIPVYTRLARPFGCLILRQLIAGQSIGEAFLEARRHLQRLGNPLGLAYSFYALSSLHLHDPDSCAWCQAHAVRQA